MDEKGFGTGHAIRENFQHFLRVMRESGQQELGLKALEGQPGVWEYRLNNEYRVYVRKNGDGSWVLLKGFEHMPVKK
jgi:hypothetical protein